MKAIPAFLTGSGSRPQHPHGIALTPRMPLQCASALRSVDTDPNVIVVKSPKSGESLLSLKQFGDQYRASYRRTVDSLLAAGVIA